TQPAMDGNRKDTPPIVVVATKQDRSRWEDLPPLKKSAKERVDFRRQNSLDDYTAWIGKATPEQALQGLPVEGLQFAAPLKEATASITVFVNGYPKTVAVAPAQEGAVSPQAFITSKENAPSIA